MLKMIDKLSSPCERFYPELDELTMHQLSEYPRESFLFDFKESSENLYSVTFHDLFHNLSCKFALEITESFPQIGKWDNQTEALEPCIVGDYPEIDLERLQKKVLGDEYLYCMILIQFQLRALKQLLLFTAKRKANKLILTFNEDNLDYSEIYEPFISAHEELPTPQGHQTQLTIPTENSLYQELIGHIEKVDREFQQTLWREQRNNPILRHYLKLQAIV